MGTHTANNGRGIIRAFKPGVEVREAADGGMPTLHGHFAVFNRWTEINSWFEGNFLERIAPGAFKKTMSENRSSIKALFQHGADPQIGDKPLGPVELLEEDRTGAYYEVPLLDTAYNRELIPGLEAGLYGASFRFQVVREDRNEEPEASGDNPQGLPERTIKELRLFEFGPVTFPAYDDATAGVRSLTDRFLFDAIERDPVRARELLEATAETRDEDPDPDGDPQDDPETTPGEDVESGAEGDPADDAPPEDDDRAAYTHPIRPGRREPDPLYTGKKEEPTWRL